MELINAQESNVNSTLPLLRLLKESGEDFEWYPTTDEILNTVRDGLKSRLGQSYEDKQPCVSVLDCGAGDGRALQWLAGGGDMFAIEKSKRLINEMSSDIFIVGTEFQKIMKHLRW